MNTAEPVQPLALIDHVPLVNEVGVWGLQVYK
jgi:hypothetical protein